MPTDLNQVDCSYESIYGTIVNSWRKGDNRLEWDFTIPANTSAEVWIPQKRGGYKVKNYNSGSHTINTEI